MLPHVATTLSGQVTLSSRVGLFHLQTLVGTPAVTISIVDANETLKMRSHPWLARDRRVPSRTLEGLQRAFRIVHVAQSPAMAHSRRRDQARHHPNAARCISCLLPNGTAGCTAQMNISLCGSITLSSNPGDDCASPCCTYPDHLQTRDLFLTRDL